MNIFLKKMKTTVLLKLSQGGEMENLESTKPTWFKIAPMMSNILYANFKTYM